jgi:hypothetical protein
VQVLDECDKSTFCSWESDCIVQKEEITTGQCIGTKGRNAAAAVKAEKKSVVEIFC